MTHYPFMLGIDRLRLAVHLGVGEEERAQPQTVEMTVRLYYADPPQGWGDDDGVFLCYELLSNVLHALAKERSFKLIEYLAQQSYEALGAEIVRQLGEEHGVKIWLQIHKCDAPVESLQGGSRFVYSDLNASDSVVSG